MKKAQGSLEYLIIIAAVLAIAAIVVLFLTGVFGSSKTGASLTDCKSAASRCSVELSTSSGASCDYCNKACSSVPELTHLCKQGKAKEIY